MAFDFRNLDLKNKFTQDKILIDKQPYDQLSLYSKAKEIIIESNKGKVNLTGYFELSGMKITEIVKIQKYSVKFDNKFLEKNSSNQSFHSKRILITLYNLPTDNEFLNLRELKIYLQEIGADLHEIAEKFCISLKSLRNVDFKQFVQLYSAGVDENYDFNRDNIGASYQEGSNILHKISQQKRKHKNELGENVSFDNERELLVVNNEGDSIQQLQETIIDNKIEEDSDFVNFDKEDIFFDLDAKNIQDSKRRNFKFVDPFHLNGRDKLKKFKQNYFNNSFKPCFNPKGELITLGKFNSDNFRTDLTVNKIIPNKSLLKKNISEDTNQNELNFEYLEFYQKSTILNFLSVSNNHLKHKNKQNEENINGENLGINLSSFGKNTPNKKESIEAFFLKDLTINEYTDLIDEYLRDLINYKSQVKETTRQDRYSTKLMDKFEKEIETMKLFKILFLNCFKTGNPQQFNQEIISYSEEVKRMRKKKLTDWLIENLNFKASEVVLQRQSIGQHNDQIFGEVLKNLLNGKIRKAIDICNKNGLFDLSMIIASTNPFTKNKLIHDGVKNWKKMNLYESFPANLQKIYDLLSGEEILKDKDIGKKIISLCDWRQLLLCLSLYSLEPTKDISQIVREFDTIMNVYNSPDNLLPLADTRNHNNKVYDINYILIKLFHAIDTNNSVEIKKFMNYLTNSYNIYDEFSDSHLHYIIITILLNTLQNSEERFFSHQPGLRRNIDFNFARQLHSNLLIRVVEEILQSEGESSNYNWKYAINLVHNSNISLNSQKLIFEEIIFKKIEDIKKDEFFIKNSINPSLSNEAIGLMNLNEFNLKAAYDNFKKSKNFNKASEIFIFYFLSLRIIENNFNNETNEEMDFLSSYSVNSHIWEKYGAVFHQYLNLLRRLEGGEEEKLGAVDLSFIRNLIKKVDAISTNEDYISLRNLINLCRNSMLSNLRRIYNLKAEITSRKDMNVKFSFIIFLDAYLHNA